jgi:hypothetical protein
VRVVVVCVLLLLAAAPAAAEPPGWTVDDGHLEVGVGAALAISKVTSPSGFTIDAAWIRRRPLAGQNRVTGILATIFLGNERGVRLRARVLDDSALGPSRGPEVTIGGRVHLGVARPGGRMRGPAYLGVLLPELGVVLGGERRLRAMHLGLARLPLGRLLRDEIAIGFDVEVALALPLDGGDAEAVVTIGAAVVQL